MEYDKLFGELFDTIQCDMQSSMIRRVHILFFEGYVLPYYVRTLTYSILVYVNKNRIRCNYNTVV